MVRPCPAAVPAAAGLLRKLTVAARSIPGEMVTLAAGAYTRPLFGST